MIEDSYVKAGMNELVAREKHVCTLVHFGMEIAEAASMSTPELEALQKVLCKY